jgi:hypothetical protein
MWRDRPIMRSEYSAEFPPGQYSIRLITAGNVIEMSTYRTLRYSESRKR